MTDALLTMNDKKEQLSLAYVAALAAGGGYTVSTRNSDRDSIDVTVHSRTRSYAAVSFQLKATSVPDWVDDELRFQLSSKNFNELESFRQTPALLAVMVLPFEPTEWLSVDDKQLVLRRCVWWVSLRGNGQTSQGSRQVRLPRANLLTVDTLRDLITMSEEGTL